MGNENVLSELVETINALVDKLEDVKYRQVSINDLAKKAIGHLTVSDGALGAVYAIRVANDANADTISVVKSVLSKDIKFILGRLDR